MASPFDGNPMTVGLPLSPPSEIERVTPPHGVGTPPMTPESLSPGHFVGLARRGNGERSR